jgi:hypothetical protein
LVSEAGRRSGRPKKGRRTLDGFGVEGLRFQTPGGSGYGVEVVDVKCGNPMSSRLRKLGFSKLSETFA